MQPRQFNRYRIRNPKNVVSTTNTKQAFDLIKWTSLLTPLIILLGICRLYYYYRSFGINIVPFLEFGEILTSISDYLVTFFVIVSPTFLLLVAIVAGPYKKITVAWIIAALLLQIIVYVITAANVENYFILPIQLVTVVFILPLGLYFYLKLRRVATEKLEMAPYITASIICFILSSSTVGRQNAIYVRRKKAFENVNIRMKDSTTILSDSSYYYIGNTTNYIFFYNEKEKKTTIMKMDDVKSIIFPNKAEKD
jgi:hypothetical protein